MKIKNIAIAILAIILVMGTIGCGKKAPEALVVPTDTALYVDGATTIHRFEMVCANPNGGSIWLSTFYYDGTKGRQEATLDLTDLSDNEVEAIKSHLQRFQTCWIDPDYVTGGPRPDPFNRGVYKYPVSIMRNSTGVIVKINDINALNWIQERSYSVRTTHFGKGRITPEGIQESVKR